MSQLSQLVEKLPVYVQTNQNLNEGRKSLLLEGETLVLLYLYKVDRVKAIDERTKKVYHLPLSCQEKFERLPDNPKHDDTSYPSVTAVIEKDPLPTVLRVIEEWGTDDEKTHLDINDIIQVTGVKCDTEYGRILLGINPEGYKLFLQENEIKAKFTAMLCHDAQYLSDVIECKLPKVSDVVRFKLPKRIRAPPQPNTIKRRDQLQVLILTEVESQSHVIATSKKTDKIMSIPVDIEGTFKVLENQTEALQNIGPLLGSLNTTLNVADVGLAPLLPTWKEVPFPIRTALDAWLGSYQGKTEMNGQFTLEKVVEDLESEIKELKPMLDNLYLDFKEKKDVDLTVMRGERDVPAPPLPPRDTNKPKDDRPPPMRPPKPRTLKGPPSALTKRPREPEPVAANLREASKSSDDEFYEDPDLNLYESIPDVSRRKSKGPDTTIEEVKARLAMKERECTTLKMELSMTTNWKEKALAKENECKMLNERVKEIEKEFEKKGVGYVNLLQSVETVQKKKRVESQIRQARGRYEQLTLGPESALNIEHIREFSKKEVGNFLEEVGLSQYVERFDSELIDGDMLLDLTEQMLITDLGLSEFHARKLLNRLEKKCI